MALNPPAAWNAEVSKSPSIRPRRVRLWPCGDALVGAPPCWTLENCGDPPRRGADAMLVALSPERCPDMSTGGDSGQMTSVTEWRTARALLRVDHAPLQRPAACTTSATGCHTVARDPDTRQRGSTACAGSIVNACTTDHTSGVAMRAAAAMWSMIDCGISHTVRHSVAVGPAIK